MQTKIEFILSASDVADRVPNFDITDGGHLATLVSDLIAELGLDLKLGGWLCKAAKTKDGGVKITGKLVPPGGAVLG